MAGLFLLGRADWEGSAMAEPVFRLEPPSFEQSVWGMRRSRCLSKVGRVRCDKEGKEDSCNRNAFYDIIPPSVKSYISESAQ